MGTVNPVVITTRRGCPDGGDRRRVRRLLHPGHGPVLHEAGPPPRPRRARAAAAVVAAAAQSARADRLAAHRADRRRIPDRRRRARGRRGDGARPDRRVPRGLVGAATVLLVAAADALSRAARLLEECFGPVALVAEYADRPRARRGARRLQGALAASVMSAGRDDPETAGRASRSLRSVGRVAVDDWPTGVAFTWAQQHGGPWPATTAPAATSVGAAALDRFIRPVRTSTCRTGAAAGRCRRTTRGACRGGSTACCDGRIAMTAPLDGLLVADFSRVLAGPLATTTLADLGATVVKVERPGSATTPALGSAVDRRPRASYFECANRSKQSVELDLARPGRPGPRARAGPPGRRRSSRTSAPARSTGRASATTQVAAANPRRRLLLDHRVRQRAGADLPGYDFLVQAVGGLMSITGEPDGEPTKVGVALVDVLTAKDAVIGILAALPSARAHGPRPARRGQPALQPARLAGQPGRRRTSPPAAPARMGNRHPSIAPYETLRCRGRLIWPSPAATTGSSRGCAGARPARRWPTTPRSPPTPPGSRTATSWSRRSRRRLAATTPTPGSQRSPPPACRPARSATSARLRAGRPLGLDPPSTSAPGTRRRFATPSPTRSSPCDALHGRRPRLGEHNDQIRHWLTHEGDPMSTTATKLPRLRPDRPRRHRRPAHRRTRRRSAPRCGSSARAGRAATSPTGSSAGDIADIRGLAKELGVARRARHAPGGLRLRRHERRRLRPGLPGARGRRLRHPLARLGAGLARDVRDLALGHARSRSRSGCPRMAAGEAIGCFGLTEPDHGSDPASMRTRARRDGDDWVLDGRKMWITNGSDRRRRRGLGADRRRHPRLRRADRHPGLLRAGDQAQDVAARLGDQRARARRRPAAGRRRLPEVRGLQGPAVAASTRPATASSGARSAPRAPASRRRSTTPSTAMQFGRPIAGFQLTQEKLADMALELHQGQAARAAPGPAQGRRDAAPRAGQPRQAQQRPGGARDLPHRADHPGRQRDLAGVPGDPAHEQPRVGAHLRGHRRDAHPRPRPGADRHRRLPLTASLRSRGSETVAAGRRDSDGSTRAVPKRDRE